MADAAKLGIVRPIDFHTEGVVEQLEELLEMARSGEIKSVACVYEYVDGKMAHAAAFGDFSNRNATVGRLHVLAQHITLNELLQWKPSG